MFSRQCFNCLIVSDVNHAKVIFNFIGISIFLGLMHCKERSFNPPKLDVASRSDGTLTFLTEVATESSIEIVRFSMKDGKGLTWTDDPRFTTIHDPNKGLIYLDHKLKKFRQVPPPKIPERKTDSESTDQELKQYEIVEKATKMAYTGKEKTIGNWRCEEFVIFDSYKLGVPPHLESSIIVWISDEIENGKALQKQKFDLVPLPILSDSSKISGKDLEIPGFSVQMIKRKANELPEITTFKKITAEPLKKADFEVPAGYSSVDE